MTNGHVLYNLIFYKHKYTHPYQVYVQKKIALQGIHQIQALAISGKITHGLFFHSILCVSYYFLPWTASCVFKRPWGLVGGNLPLSINMSTKVFSWTMNRAIGLGAGEPGKQVMVIWTREEATSTRIVYFPLGTVCPGLWEPYSLV